MAPAANMRQVPKVHFVGVAGNGVSALAQFHAMGGGQATGSDRTFDRGGAQELASKLKALGITLYPQDGSALDAKPDEVVASAAVEADNPDLERAKRAGLTAIHRADCLARYVAEYRTIAVAGTSGKSTVVAMIYEILESAGLSPSVITGGALVSLERRGLVGNALRGKSDLMVVEADESDGTLTRYKPWLGVLLNISKDHKEIAELREMFGTFLKDSSSRLINADVPDFGMLEKGAVTFGSKRSEFEPPNSSPVMAEHFRVENIRLEPRESRFSISGVQFRLPMPGRHNVENVLAAVAASVQAGVSINAAAKALASFQGVARRFERIGEAGGVEVIDDFAHNPAKVAAALEAAHLKSGRLRVIFQLHGYAPAKFLRQEFIDVFATALSSQDELWMPEIYYAGGTASKTISAKEIADAISARGRNAKFVEIRATMIPELIKSVQRGDTILVMGARDPSLHGFAQNILAALSRHASLKT